MDQPTDYHFDGAHPLYGLGNMQLKFNEYNHGMSLFGLPLFAALIALYKEDIESLTHYTIKTIERGKEHLITIHHAMLGSNDTIAMDHD